jgi:hypothetical protein
MMMSIYPSWINYTVFRIDNSILTGLSGDAARSSFTDIRIQDGKIIELGQLTAQPRG